MAEVGADALAAGGKRLRPLLAFLCAPPGPAPVAAGVAVELVHMATLVHDDLIDGATPRGATPPPGRPTARTPPAPAATTSSRARSRSCRRRRPRGGRRPRRCLPLPRPRRGDAAPPAHDPETTVEAYLERCALKTGKLFEAACPLGSGGALELGEFGLNLGIAFQIADDILDCAGQTIETGKVAGTDLREGTPTLPLLLAARDDDVVRAALAAARSTARSSACRNGALERSREVALDYARPARNV